MSEVFKCRIIKPSSTPWVEVQADTIEDAASKFYSRIPTHQSSVRWRLEDGSYAHFVLYEVENGESLDQFIGRWFTKGITRKGGFKSGPQTLKQLAEILGWTKDPNDLLTKWEGEEDEWYDSSGKAVSV
jgi:hypothetical protein